MPQEKPRAGPPRIMRGAPAGGRRVVFVGAKGLGGRGSAQSRLEPSARRRAPALDKVLVTHHNGTTADRQIPVERMSS